MCNLLTTTSNLFGTFHLPVIQGYEYKIMLHICILLIILEFSGCQGSKADEGA